MQYSVYTRLDLFEAFRRFSDYTGSFLLRQLVLQIPGYQRIIGLVPPPPCTFFELIAGTALQKPDIVCGMIESVDALSARETVAETFWRAK